jgi:hypothetical protein
MFLVRDPSGHLWELADWFFCFFYVMPVNLSRMKNSPFFFGINIEGEIHGANQCNKFNNESAVVFLFNLVFFACNFFS